MQVIQCRSRTRRSAQILGWSLFALLGVLIALSLVNRAHFSTPITILCIFGLALTKDVVAPLADRWVSGQIGESRTLKELQKLPDSYTAVTNFVVPGTERGDVDVVVIGPPGILAIEVKFYSGHILFERGRWWRRKCNGWKTRLKSNPSRQAQGHRKALLAHMMDQFNRSGFGRNINIPIVPIIVFVGADALDVNSLDIAAMRIGSLEQFIRDLPYGLSAEEIEKVTSMIVSSDKTARI